MRAFSFLLGLAAIAAVPLACSSSDDATPAQTMPENDGGPITDDDGGQVLEDGGVLDPDTGKPTYVTTTTEKFMHAGAERIYILSVPLDYDAGKKYPVYMFMHGNPGTAQTMLDYYPVDSVTKNEAIVVYPNALTLDWDHSAWSTDNADVTYLTALVDEVAAKVSIDKTRILLGGWSGGGFMASQVACRYSGLFKAIGIFSGGAPFDTETSDPNAPSPACTGAAVATIVTHGGNDNTVGPTSGDYAGMYWADKNGCGGSTTDTTPSPCKKYDGCPADKPVTVCTVPGVGHPMWDQTHAVAWAFLKSLP